MVAAHDGNVPLLQPRDDRRIEPGRPAPYGPAAKPRTHSLAARPHSRAHEQRVTSPHFHARLLFPRLKILHVYGRARLQVGNALEARDVDQYAAREDPALD